MKRILLLLFSYSCLNLLSAQYFVQYFDGADTSVQSSIFIQFEDSAGLWQVGRPQKSNFNGAQTVPNALITDTLLPVPQLDTSRCTFSVPMTQFGPWGIIGTQWVQKLDMIDSLDYGMVEFSLDTGQTWENAFNNPLTYNFYGYDPQNLDTLSSGDVVFSGTDSLWRNIWFCHDFSNFWNIDSIRYRWTFVSGDSNGIHRDGWMIDNLMSQPTIFHTVNEIEQTNYLNLSPNPVDDRLNINIKKLKELHYIEQILIHDSKGALVKKIGKRPVKTFVDVSSFSSGMYQITIETNIRKESATIYVE